MKERFSSRVKKGRIDFEKNTLSKLWFGEKR